MSTMKEENEAGIKSIEDKLHEAWLEERKFYDFRGRLVSSFGWSPWWWSICSSIGRFSFVNVGKPPAFSFSSST